jgi:hypothetical protein
MADAAQLMTTELVSTPTLTLPDAAEGGVRRLSLAALLEACGAGREVLDEAFAREVALQLARLGSHVALDAVGRFGLEDVVVTFHMDRTMRLVVTGNHPETGAEVTLRWRDRDFDAVQLIITRAVVAAPCTFATLDFSVRGRAAALLRAVGGGEAGDGVTVRCLATLGEATHWRCLIGGVEVAVEHRDLRLLD